MTSIVLDFGLVRTLLNRTGFISSPAADKFCKRPTRTTNPERAFRPDTGLYQRQSDDEGAGAQMPACAPCLRSKRRIAQAFAAVVVDPVAFAHFGHRPEHQRAVPKGYLAACDVVKVESDVRLDGIFPDEGEQSVIINPAMASEESDILEDGRTPRVGPGRQRWENRRRSFSRSQRLDPRRLKPLVNAAMAHSLDGQNEQAVRGLRRALAIDPTRVAANANPGMLPTEMGHTREAEGAFRAALTAGPQSAVAVYKGSVCQDEEARLDACPRLRRSPRSALAVTAVKAS